MRPLQLRMSAFGPYGGQVEIDFEALGRSGLYLIAGDTGAGKTTIFDGITYALYGEPSGDTRQVSMLRSKYAALDTLTEVELFFENAGKRYRVKRNPGGYERASKRKGATATELQTAELTLPDGRVITRQREVNAAVAEIMGIDRGQFAQIAMIAQGDFQKLLLSSTEERKKIFRKLFATERFDELQEKLKKEAARLKDESEQLERSIRQYLKGVRCGEDDVRGLALEKAVAGECEISAVTELIRQLIAEDKVLWAQMEAEGRELQEKLDALGSAIDRENARRQAAAELERARESLVTEEARHRLCVEELERAGSHQPEIDRLTEEIGVILAGLAQYDELEELRNKEKMLRRLLAESELEKAQATEALCGIQQELDELRAEQEKLRGAGEAKATLLNRKAALERDRADIQMHLKELDTCLEMQECLLLQQEEYLQASETAKRLSEAYENANRAYLDAQAGILAQALVQGEPCPVCGSLTHPSPAKESAEAPTQAQLKKAREQAEAAKQVEERASRRAGQTYGSLKEKAKQVGTEISVPEWEAAKVTFTEKQKTLLAEWEALEEAIAKEEQKQFRCSMLEKLLPAREEERKAREARCVQLGQTIAAANAESEALKTQLAKRQEKLKYDSRERAEAAKEAAQKRKQKLLSQIADAVNAGQDSSRALDMLRGKTQQLEHTLASYEPADLAALEEGRENAVRERESRAKRQQELHTRLDANESALANISRQARAADELAKHRRLVVSLSNTANGNLTGKEKIMLETYVQMTYFDRILGRANTRLMVMSCGQYELKRSLEAENNKSQSGLDLNVVDHYNGTQRSVKTLSGGETFKASLSLALGLADEIQALAGGIRIDTMFVDEGFGALDEESLQQAFRALSSLTEGNRLVGIISHVGELKDKIDKQIVVRKLKTGGSIVEPPYGKTAGGL